MVSGVAQAFVLVPAVQAVDLGQAGVGLLLSQLRDVQRVSASRGGNPFQSRNHVQKCHFRPRILK